MENKIVIFDLNPEPAFFLAQMDVSHQEFVRKDTNPHFSMNFSFNLRLSLMQAALASELNEVMKIFELQILALSPTDHGVQVWARTPQWRAFQHNWRRFYQRQVTGDFCPKCGTDVRFGQDTCDECGESLVWLSGGVISSK